MSGQFWRPDTPQWTLADMIPSLPLDRGQVLGNLGNLGDDQHWGPDTKLPYPGFHKARSHPARDPIPYWYTA